MNYKNQIIRKLFLLVVVSTIIIFSTFSSILADVEDISRSETLYFNGIQWGPPTNFNFLTGNAAWPVPGSGGMWNEAVYETLFLYNMITGELEPFIGKGYKWVDEYTLQVELRDDVHWQDGEPFTADDVVYTFDIAKKYPLVNSGFWLYVDKISAIGKYAFSIELKKDNPNRLALVNNLVDVSILPKHIWTKIEEQSGYDIKKIREYKNENPVGSGPYKVYYYSSEKIIAQRYDNYWGKNLFGKLPTPKYLVHPIFKSNDAGNLAFEKGDVDVGQQFVPQIWKMWEKGLPVGTWYKKEPYYVPVGTPCIWFNFKRHPLDVPEVRRAIAYCIDYKKIAELAMTKYSPTVVSSLILPFGPEKKYYDEETVKKYGWEYNPQKAIEILQGIGAKKGKDDVWVLKDGTRLGPIKVECPYGWSDWQVSLEIVSKSAQKIGIDLVTYFPDQAVAADNRYSGNFDITMMTPAGNPLPSQPWSRFYEVMYAKDIRPIGELAFRNFGRYSNPRADELLDEIPKLTDEVKMKELYTELAKIYLQDIPAIPVEYRPWMFYQYNTTHWTNFPSEENPYAPPQMCITGAGIKALYEIKPVK